MYDFADNSYNYDRCYAAGAYAAHYGSDYTTARSAFVAKAAVPHADKAWDKGYSDTQRKLLGL